MRLLDVAALGELGDGARARFARVGDRRCDACRLEQESLSDAVSRHDDVARLESAEDFGGDGEPGDDDVGTFRVEARDLAPLLRRHLDEHVEDVLEVRARNVRRVHRARREDALAREIDAGEVRERSARSDQLRATPIATR